MIVGGGGVSGRVQSTSTLAHLQLALPLRGACGRQLARAQCSLRPVSSSGSCDSVSTLFWCGCLSVNRLLVSPPHLVCQALWTLILLALCVVRINYTSNLPSGDPLNGGWDFVGVHCMIILTGAPRLTTHGRPERRRTTVHIHHYSAVRPGDVSVVGRYILLPLKPSTGCSSLFADTNTQSFHVHGLRWPGSPSSGSSGSEEPPPQLTTGQQTCLRAVLASHSAANCKHCWLSRGWDGSLFRCCWLAPSMQLLPAGPGLITPMGSGQEARLNQSSLLKAHNRQPRPDRRHVIVSCP